MSTITRRHFFRDCGVGVGKIALASLLSGAVRRRRRRPPARSRSRRRSRTFPAKAKAVIHLFMAGRPSQLDLFDYKPELAQARRQAAPARGHQRAAVRLHPPRRRRARAASSSSPSTGSAAPSSPRCCRTWPRSSTTSASSSRSTPTSSTTPRRRSSSTPASRSRAGRAWARG